VEFNSQPKQLIDVESHKPKSLKLPKMWIPELGLRQEDRQIFLGHTSWLSDDIINAVQKLLKKANQAVP